MCSETQFADFVAAHQLMQMKSPDYSGAHPIDLCSLAIPMWPGVTTFSDEELGLNLRVIVKVNNRKISPCLYLELAHLSIELSE